MPGGDRIRSTEWIYHPSIDLPSNSVCVWCDDPKLSSTSYEFEFPPANTSQGGWPGRGRGASHLRGLPRPGRGAAHGVELFGLKVDPDRGLPGLRRQRVSAAATLCEVRAAYPITYRTAVRHCVILAAQHQAIPLPPLPDPPCRCSGEGCTPTRRDINVKIPAGVDNGNMLRLRSMGSVGKHGGQAGDLLIRIQVSSLGCYTLRLCSMGSVGKHGGQAGDLFIGIQVISLGYFTPCQWLRISLRLGQSHAPGPLPPPCAS